MAKVKAAKRLMAWTLHSGSIYKIENFDFSVIDSITQDGVAMNEVTSLASVISNTWYNDRTNKIIYLRTSSSTHPNGEFIAMKFWNFFSSSPVSLPYDLNNGKEIYWIPLIKSTSVFGLELDNEDQIGFALEGSGSLKLGNDRDYWDSRYEGYIFEQQPCLIYSYFTGLDAGESKLIYSGLVNAKAFSGTGVDLKLKDTLSQLRAEFEMPNISEIGDALVPEALSNAKQRRVYGKVFGHRPTNINQTVNGYVLSGTVFISALGSTVTGSGTSFLIHFSPDDRIIIDEQTYTVKSVTGNTTLDVNDTFEFDLTGVSYALLPDLPKNFINRRFLVAGHECRQPTTTIASVDALNRIYLTDATDIDEGDEIFIGDPGSGEIVVVSEIHSDGLMILSQNLVGIPMAGTSVVRFCAQNVRINNTKLIYDRDYTISFSGNRTEIILDADAEKNIHAVRGVIGSNVNFTSSSRSVTGSGTVFTSQLKPNQWIRSVGQFDFFEILSIESDTALTLRTEATYTQSDTAQYIADFAYDEEIDVLTCEIIGTTDDDTSDGTLLRTASKITEDIITRVGITNLSAPAFLLSHETQPAYLGMAIPLTYTDTKQPKCRDLINKINFSVFGALIQNEDFEIEYNILQPKKPSNYLTLGESDILDLNIESNNDRVCKTSIINYKNQEYNAESAIPSIATYTKESDIGTWLVSSMNTKVVDTILHREKDARIHANRWSFLLELATNKIKIKTKMQASRLQVNDVIFIEHEKLYERSGGGKRKFAAISSIKKSGTNVELELDDLSNAFNRVCIISPNDTPEFDDSSAQQKAKFGYITDQYGLINNDETTFGLNLIW